MASVLQLFDQPRDLATWDKLVTSAGGHLLQTWAWGELKAQFGWQVQRLGATETGATGRHGMALALQSRLSSQTADEPAPAPGPACAQVLYRSLPAGLGSIAYIPKGPLLDWEDQKALREFFDVIEPLARQQRAICLKVEPDRVDSPAMTDSLRALGFRPSPQTIQPRRTILVELDADDEMLQRMKSKTRYNIRLAARRGVTVRPGQECDLPAFYQLMALTAVRDEFGIHSQRYYQAVYRLFVPAGQGQLLLAEHEGQLLAGLVVLAADDTACYMYGASSNEGRNLMPTYLLQWEAMRWARERGCRFYDLWGVPDEDEGILEDQFTERNDGLWGVYRFKRGFGGRLVRSAGTWDLVYARLRYRLYAAAVELRAARQAD